MLEYNYLGKSYKDLGVSYFEKGRPTGHSGVDAVLSCIRTRRLVFLGRKQETAWRWRAVKKEKKKTWIVKRCAPNVP